MKNKIAITALVLAGFATSVFAAVSYKYKCSRCGLIQEYDRPGIYKCPKDGSVMFGSQ
jgi:hypothetical protein